LSKFIDSTCSDFVVGRGPVRVHRRPCRETFGELAEASRDLLATEIVSHRQRTAGELARTWLQLRRFEAIARTTLICRRFAPITRSWYELTRLRLPVKKHIGKTEDLRFIAGDLDNMNRECQMRLKWTTGDCC